MPLYEYRCTHCGHMFEKLQSYTAAAEPCPRCAGEVERLLSAPAIQFKGSGFYLTDYGKSGGGAAKSGSGESNASTGETAKSSGETEKAAPASSGSSDTGSSTPSSGSSSSTGSTSST